MNKSVGDKVGGYFTKNANVNTHIDDMCDDLNLTEKQVLNAIGHALNYVGGVPEWRSCLVEVVPHTVWRYERVSKPVSSKALYEEIGRYADGVILVNDEEKRVYRLTELVTANA